MLTTQYIPRPVWLLVITAVLSLQSCGEAPTLQPPSVRWGQDVCAECGMILSDDRFAGAVITIRGGERQEYLYDDLGEMLAHPPEITGDFKQWVRDMKTREWIDATTAHYVRSRQLHTPMGFGVAALASSVDAKAVSEEVSGEHLTLDELQGSDSVGRKTTHSEPHAHDKPTEHSH